MTRMSFLARGAGLGVVIIALLTAMVAMARAEPVQEHQAALGFADDEIVRAVREELARDEHHASAGLDARVNAGIVELRGTLPLSAWRERAERVARAVHGVRAVLNRIRVVPERRRDAEILREVGRALQGSPALESLPIRVSVQNGVVELTGAITSWEEQQLAERVARGVVGVRFCENQLTSRRNMPRTSAILAGDVRGRLAWDPLVQHDPIEIGVRGTGVWLSGRVGSQAELRQAVSLAWVKGVSAVDSSGLVITLAPRPNSNVRTRGLTDAQILATVKDLRPYWPNLANASFSVDVVNGTASLRGTVASLADSWSAEQMVRSVVNVVAIKNELRGTWWQPPPRVTPPRRQRSRR
jgi:osmotically-inducible protein OsmY